MQDYQEFTAAAGRLPALRADYFKVVDEPDADVKQVHIDMATEAVIADVEAFTDELGAACMYRSSVCSDRATRLPGRLEQADDAIVLHAALRAALRDDAETATAAIKLLAERHIKNSAVRIQKLASKYAAGGV